MGSLKLMNDYKAEYSITNVVIVRNFIDHTRPVDLDGSRPLCSTFACGRTLSLIESLAGGKCTGCMGKKGVDILKVIKR